MVGKRLVNTGGVVEAFDPLKNFETVTYTGNGGTQKITGYIRKGAAFDGSSSKIQINQDTIGVNDFSVSMWFNTSSLSSNQYLHYLHNYGVYIDTNGYINFYTNSNLTYSTAISTNTWYHVALVKSSTTGKFIYLNGSEVATDATDTGDVSSLFGSSPYQKAYIGAAIYNTSTDWRWFNGKIDQVRIFDKALSQSEVDTLEAETYASSTKSTTDIFGDGSGVALYELDEDANSSNFKQAAVFNGSSSKIVTSPQINQQAFSFSLWFKYTSTDIYEIIWEYHDGGSDISGTPNALFMNTQPSGGVSVALGYNGSYKFNFTHSTTGLNDGNWHHAVFSWDGTTSANAVKFYVDNVVTSSTSSLAASSMPTYNGLGIGSRYINTLGMWSGSIDQIRIYSSALSSSDVTNLYNETSVPTSTLVAHYKLDGNALDETGTYNGTASSVTYTNGVYGGTPTNVNFLGMAFQPDLVWIKDRDDAADQHALFDTVRGATKRVFSSSTSEETTTATTLTSFDSNGFSLSSSPAVNQNGNDFVAWCWKAGGAAGTYNIDGTGHATLGAAGLSITGINGCSPTFTGCSVNSESGFGIYEIDPNFTASSHRADFAHGLKSTPQLIFAKVIDGTGGNWWAFTNAIDGSWDRGKLQTTDAFIDDTLTGADIATDTLIRIEDAFISTASRVLFYAFASVDGYQKVGTYEGSNSGGNSITGIGFSPRFVVIKNVDAIGNWIVHSKPPTTTNPSTDHLRWNTTAATDSGAGEQINFDSDGFTLNSTSQNVNTSHTYIYLAIA